MAGTPPASRQRERAYDAFLSYSHTVDGRPEQGLRCAQAVRRGLVRLMRPWYRRHPGLEIYLDQTSLPAGDGLWPSLERALRDSDHLVLLASPEAARSPYVRDEVGHWAREREPGTLLIALTRGEIRWSERHGDFDWEHTDALPREALAGFFPAEPTWVDLRPAAVGSRLSLRNERFRTAVSALAAPLHGVDKAAIVRVDERQRRKSIGLAVTVLSILLAMVMTAGGLALWQWRVAEAQAQRSLSRQLAAESAALMETSPDLASLLAVEAYRVSPTPEATASLFRASGLPLKRRLPLSGPVTSFAGRDELEPQSTTAVVSNDGRMVAHEESVKGRSAIGPHRITVRSSESGRVLKRFRINPDDTGKATDDTGLGDDAFPDDPWGITLAFDPQDRYLAVGYGKLGLTSQPSEVHIWDVRTGRHLRTLTGARGTEAADEEQLEQLEFSADGRRLAGGSLYGTVRVWDLGTGKTLSRFAGYPFLNTRMAISRDHSSVAMSSEKGELSVWRMPDGGGRRQLVGKEDPPTSAVAFSPDSRILAAGQKDGSVRLWRMPGAKPLRTLAGQRSTHIRTLAFSPDGGMLAAGNNDGTVTLLDAVSGRALGTISDREQTQGSRLSFGTDSTLLINTTKNLRIYDLSAVRPRTVFPVNAGQTGAVTFNGDGSGLLFVGGRTGTVLWPGERDGAGGRVEWAGGREARRRAVQLRAPGWLIGPVTAFRDGERPLAVGVKGRRAGVLDVRTGKPLRTFPVPGWDQDPVALSAGGSRLAAVTGGGVRVWAVRSGELLMERKSSREQLSPQPSALHLSPDGRTLALGTDDGTDGDTTEIWDTGTGDRLQTLPDGLGVPLGFSPDGRTLAVGVEPYSAQADAGVHLWDVPGGRKRASLVGHTNYVRAAAFSRDRRTVATGGEDGTVRLWDADSGMLRATLDTPDGAPRTLALSPDGRTLGVGTSGGGIQLWRVTLPTPGAAVRKICEAVGRGLTGQERSTYLPDGEDGSGCR